MLLWATYSFKDYTNDDFRLACFHEIVNPSTFNLTYTIQDVEVYIGICSNLVTFCKLNFA